MRIADGRLHRCRLRHPPLHRRRHIRLHHHGNRQRDREPQVSQNNLIWKFSSWLTLMLTTKLTNRKVHCISTASCFCCIKTAATAKQVAGIVPDEKLSTKKQNNLVACLQIDDFLSTQQQWPWGTQPFGERRHPHDNLCRHIAARVRIFGLRRFVSKALTIKLNLTDFG